MKEYWVNVYPAFERQILGKTYTYPWTTKTALYRLHVREFETKEAKELYLKMKYGKPILYNSWQFVQYVNSEYDKVLNEHD